jgi:hypothetical protein
MAVIDVALYGSSTIAELVYKSINFKFFCNFIFKKESEFLILLEAKFSGKFTRFLLIVMFLSFGFILYY